MSAPAGDLTDTQVEQAELVTLAAEMTARGWFSWAEKIADTDSPADAARMLARALATSDVALSE